ncbi:MAG: hypothetical protein ACRCSK_04265 [Fusobacteriaceae bacterium]
MIKKIFLQEGKLFWLLPLRIYLGVSWLKSGLGKAMGDWSSSPKLQPMYDGLASSGFVPKNPSVYFQTDFYNYILKKIILPNQIVFQIFTFIFEIAIGAALLIGFCTFIFSIISILMLGNFMSFTGLPYAALWYLFGAIAMLSGGGKVFGLDIFMAKYFKRFKFFAS